MNLVPSVRIPGPKSTCEVENSNRVVLFIYEYKQSRTFQCTDDAAKPVTIIKGYHKNVRSRLQLYTSFCLYQC